MKNIIFGLLLIWITVGCGGGGSSPTNTSPESVEDNSNIPVQVVDVAKPKNIQAKSLFYNMDVAWDKNSDIESYDVSYSVEETDVWKEITLKERTSKEVEFNIRAFSFSKLMPSTLYHFRIRAKNYNGNYSEYSYIDKKTLEETTDKAVILVHGLRSGASTWDLLAPKLSKQMGIENNKYVEIAVDINIKKDSECQDAKLQDKKIKCNELSHIVKQEPFRKVSGQANETIFGLDKENFEVTSIKWKLNTEKDSKATGYTFSKFDKYSKQRVFAINFSNNDQLTFDAQGYQLGKIIENIKKLTGVGKFDIIGHSMGGLAARAYIQNENTENIGQYISVDTPHFGAGRGLYIGLAGRNAAVNLYADSKAIHALNSEEKTTGKYDSIKVYHLGYSDGLEGLFDNGTYYDEGDGIVNIGSQMGLDSLNPTRVIFSPTVKDDIKEYKDTLTGFSRNVDMVIQSINYDWDTSIDSAHTMILKDEAYINTLIGIVENEEVSNEPSTVYTTATIKIINNTDHSMSQLYIKDENKDDWGKDLVTGVNKIGKGDSKSLTTLECDKNIDIKTTGLFGADEMKILEKYIECGKEYSFESPIQKASAIKIQ